jgi:O-antigen/teichoic acid export membrane protein
MQAAYFVLIARTMGPSTYGAFVAIVALTAIVSPFSGLGSCNLFIKNVKSGKRSAAVCWGNGILLTTVSGTLFSLLTIAINYAFHLKTQFTVVAIVCFSDLILMRITELAAFGFAASGRMKDTSIQNVVISLLRLLAILVLAFTLHKVSLQQWTNAYLVTGILGVIYAIYMGSRMWGMPQIDFAALREDAKEGVYFSISTSAQTIYNDIDKTMLAKLSDFTSTGIYAAAYRIIDVSLTPVRSLVSAAYPEFFRIGTEGVQKTYPYARKLIYRSSIYGLANFVLLMLFAPLLPHILGPKYLSAVPATQWLALIPFLRCIHLFLADSLSGAGYQRVRTLIQAGIAIFNVVLNLLILPRWSWRGAAWTSLVSDAALALTLWLVVRYYLRQEQNVTVAQASAQNV